MGFLGWGGIGQGIQSAGDNFTRLFLGIKQLQEEAKRREMQGDLIKAQTEDAFAQAAQRKQDVQRNENVTTAIKSAFQPSMQKDDAWQDMINAPESAGYFQPSNQAGSWEDAAQPLTEKGSQRLEGLMSGGFDFNKALQNVLPYTPAHNMPQMFTAIKTIQQMPLEQQLKLAELYKTHSETQKNLSDNVSAIGAGDRIIRYNKKTGEVVGDPIEVGVSPNTQVRIDAGAIGKSFTDKVDYESAKKMIGTLPTLKSDAETAAGSITKMKQMVDYIEKGDAGARGKLKAELAPYAEALGFKAKNLSDAQTYQLLAKTIAGSMRMSILGPGQVSNYEQQLLQSITGGGTTASSAAKELLNYYQSEAQKKINNYNNTVDSLAEISPKSRNMWKRIDVPATSVAGNTGNIPQDAINFLKSNPATAIFFDQKYGTGSAKRVLGGQ